MKVLKLISFLLLSWNYLAAQTPNFSVALSTDSLLFGNYVEVKFTIENASTKHFDAPEFVGFDVISGPNVSSSYSVVNGTVSQTASYTYYLQPRNEGSIFIPAATVDLGEQILETEPVELMVYPNPDGIIQKPKQERRRLNFFEDFNDIKPQPRKKMKKKRKTYRL